jgi:mRNA interferase MazF
MRPSPTRGEIWWADLEPTRGHEQGGRRPVLVISTNYFNSSPADLVLVAPLTRTDRGIPIHIPIQPPEGGVTARSLILCDALRSISKGRLGDRPLGVVSIKTMQRVESILRLLMKL